MREDHTIPAGEHRLELVGRGHLAITGGENLHIGKLALDGGELHVDGWIDSVTYEENTGGQGGFFSRLFG